MAQPGADTLATIKRNAGTAYDLVARDAHLAGPADWLPLPGGRQMFRIQHQTRKTRWGLSTTETLYGFMSLEPERASALRLLRLTRGPWTVENRNHFPRDGPLGEDASRSCTGPGPAGNAALHNLALALLAPQEAPGRRGERIRAGPGRVGCARWAGAAAPGPPDASTA